MTVKIINLKKYISFFLKSGLNSFISSKEIKKISIENLISEILSNGCGYLTFIILQNFLQPVGWRNLWGFAFWNDSIIISQFFFNLLKLLLSAIIALLITHYIAIFIKNYKDKLISNNNDLIVTATEIDYDLLARDNFVSSIVSFFSGLIVFNFISLFIEPKGLLNLWGFAFWKNTIFIDSLYFSIIVFIISTIIGALISLIVIKMINFTIKEYHENKKI